MKKFVSIKTEDISKMRNGGHSIKEIASHFGVSESFVKQRLRRNIIHVDSCDPLLKKLHKINAITNSGINKKIHYILDNFPEVKKEIDDYCSDDPQASIMEKIYRIKNNLNEKPKCQCGNALKFVLWKYSYNDICGRECKFYNEHTFSKNRKTNIERYGVEHPLQSDSIKEKIKKTCIVKYGVDHPSKNAEVANKIKNSNIINGLFLRDKRLKEYVHIINNERKSEAENEFLEFIKTLDENIVINDRSLIYPYELDALSYGHKIAIDYNGIFYNDAKDKLYHLNKTVKCDEHGYTCVHILEDEWIYKKDIVKSKLLNLFGKSKTIYARKTKIVIPSKEQVKEFLQNNHLQGYHHYEVAIGLEHEGILVSLITLGKSRFSNSYEWELLRFCNKLNISVVGGLSKMLKHFEITYKPKSLVSYCDRRWSNGKSYRKIGMDLNNISSPNYFYFRVNDNSETRTLYSRQKFQKHKLSRLLNQYDPRLTEWENMRNNGWDRIWDCGNYVFVKKYM